ncbi:MAG: hypothetical protein QE263_04300 [Vampirovibrionales bacterium]|nr:hypothetical protein [Vampirovibrionales bacterium]
MHKVLACFLISTSLFFVGCDLNVSHPPSSDRYALLELNHMVFLLDNQNGKVWRNVVCKKDSPPNCFQIMTFVDVAPKINELEQKGEMEIELEKMQLELEKATEKK